MNKANFNPKLYLVTDRDLSLGRSLEEIVEAAIKGGTNLIQLREKEASTGEFVDLAKRLMKITSSYNVPLIVNDRVDVALAAKCDGVHIGQSDMNYTDARNILGNDAIIGLSIETLEQAKEANNLDVDYIAASPVFSTPTKTDTAPAFGLDGLTKIREISRHKIVAIGGINKSNAADVISAGAHSLAIVSAICSANNPVEASKELADIIDKNREG